MTARLARLVHSVLLRVSPAYHSRAVARYWRNAEATHAEMGDDSFDFYAARIADALGPPMRCGLVLDHGAGEGSIGTRLVKIGYKVEFSEFAPQFVDRIRRAGFRCYDVSAVPAGRFDTVFANNSIFYVHPSRLEHEISWLLERLRPGGRLYLLDVPTHQRSGALQGGRVHRIVRRLTSVYQPDAGGFFLDERRLRDRFQGLQIQNSWNDYRCHMVLSRS